MNERFKVPTTFRIACLIMAATGTICFILGLQADAETAWGSFLIAAYYFVEIAVGAAFFLAIQYISQSGWSSAFRRVPEAIMAWFPWAAVLMLLLYFGMHNIYHWSHEEEVTKDALLQHKNTYLNGPFFFIRIIIFFGAWTILSVIMRRLSVREDNFDPEDQAGILAIFKKSELYSKVFIFVLALTFSLAAFDWVMSLEPHWYSSIFAFKDFVSSFLHGTSIVALIVFILYRLGYYPFLNEYHLHDFARYIFIISIIWGYMWFSQFMIIWYGNIPEETQYYFYRWEEGWKILFWLQIALNWGVPFLVLLPVPTSKKMSIITGVILVLIIGQYIDIFVGVMPGLGKGLSFGWIEAGTFLGFAGLFAFVVSMALSRAGIVPKNHPYLVESLEHQFD